MAFFKVKVQREFCSSPRTFNVVASKSQEPYKLLRSNYERKE
jgi:hypothetical protein